MFHFIFAYFSHLIKSFHLHGIHSPFVFQLEKKCLRDARSYVDYVKLSRFRESLHHNKSSLHIEDYGAGSRVFTSNDRKVSHILQHNCSTVKDTQLLYRLCAYFQVNTVLELGTSLGVATHAMATSRPQAQITTVEGSPEVYEFAKKALEEEAMKQVNFVNATFKDFFKNQKTPAPIYDLIYMDGHHNGTATRSYFESILTQVHNDTVVIFDDIYWSEDMTRAWNQICHHPQVTVSVDCFDFGLIFFRKEQRQERFYVKL